MCGSLRVPGPGEDQWALAAPAFHASSLDGARDPGTLNHVGDLDLFVRFGHLAPQGSHCWKTELLGRAVLLYRPQGHGWPPLHTSSASSTDRHMFAVPQSRWRAQSC